MKDPEFKKILEQLGHDGGAGLGPGGGGADGDGALPVDESLASTLQMLAKMSMAPGMEPEAAEAMGEEVLQKMVEEFSRMGSKDDVGPSVENMMRQLLSKDIMYIPLQQTCEKVSEEAQWGAVRWGSWLLLPGSCVGNVRLAGSAADCTCGCGVHGCGPALWRSSHAFVYVLACVCRRACAYFCGGLRACRSVCVYCLMSWRSR